MSNHFLGQSDRLPSHARMLNRPFLLFCNELSWPCVETIDPTPSTYVPQVTVSTTFQNLLTHCKVNFDSPSQFVQNTSPDFHCRVSFYNLAIFRLRISANSSNHFWSAFKHYSVKMHNSSSFIFVSSYCHIEARFCLHSFSSSANLSMLNTMDRTINIVMNFTFGELNGLCDNIFNKIFQLVDIYCLSFYHVSNPLPFQWSLSPHPFCSIYIILSSHWF